jgi:SulP family sulfate permease
MIHSLTLLLILLFFGRRAALIPMASLAGILFVVAYNMSEWHLFVKIFRSTRSDFAVLAVSFTLTILVDLAVAIQVGVVLASLLFMLRMSSVTQTGYITDAMDSDDFDERSLESRSERIPRGVEVFEINGPFFFGAADRFKDALGEVARKPKVLILRMRHVPMMDSTGLRALEDVVERSLAEGTQVVLSAVAPQPVELLERSGLLARLGGAHVAADIDAAIERARRRFRDNRLRPFYDRRHVRVDLLRSQTRAQPHLHQTRRQRRNQPGQRSARAQGRRQDRGLWDRR